MTLKPLPEQVPFPDVDILYTECSSDAFTAALVPKHEDRNIPSGPVKITVACSLGALSLSTIQAAPKFRDVIKSLILKHNQGEEPCFTAMTIDSVVAFGKNLGFFTATASISQVVAGQRKPVPGFMFIRGDAVTVFILLHFIKEGARQFAVVVVNQVRAAFKPLFVDPSGAVVKTMMEAPAGMLDSAGTFQAVAIKELQEETGIVLTKEDEMVPLFTFAPSAGGCDENIMAYLVQKEVDEAQVMTLIGKNTGNAKEDEHIVTGLLDIPRLVDCVVNQHSVIDAKLLAMLAFVTNPALMSLRSLEMSTALLAFQEAFQSECTRRTLKRKF